MQQMVTAKHARFSSVIFDRCLFFAAYLAGENVKLFCAHQQATHVLGGNMTRNKQQGHIVYLCHIRLPPTWWHIALRQVISALRRQGLAIFGYVLIFLFFFFNKITQQEQFLFHKQEICCDKGHESRYLFMAVLNRFSQRRTLFLFFFFNNGIVFF